MTFFFFFYKKIKDLLTNNVSKKKGQHKGDDCGTESSTFPVAALVWFVENEHRPWEGAVGQRTWGWRVNCVGGEWAVLISCGWQGACPMLEQEIPEDKSIF